MAETYKFSSGEEKSQETSDDYYPASRTQEVKNTSVNSLQLTLNAQKTKLRSC